MNQPDWKERQSRHPKRKPLKACASPITGRLSHVWKTRERVDGALYRRCETCGTVKNLKLPADLQARKGKRDLRSK